MKTIYNPIEELDAIFWDFDGVLLNSNEIRDKGFTEVLKAYPKEDVKQLLDFHQQNGGLSRYVKFRYFFETIRNESITEEEVQQWANRFSVIMRELLTKPELQISETIGFIRKLYKDIPMYIVSGSDQNELRFLCKTHKIAHYFKRIHGSPKPKKEWVKIILNEENIPIDRCVLVGDSVNDLEAADENSIKFIGYNNPKVEEMSTVSINFNAS